jgi:hypothetical protein
MKNSLDYVLSIYGEKAKIILMSRHGDKTPENHITNECLANVINYGMPGIDSRINIFQHGTNCVRSEETGYAAVIWILTNGGKISKHLPADSRLGSDELFKELFTDEVKENNESKQVD